VSAFTKGQRLLDRFVLLDPVGRGGQAEVWRALDEHRSAQLALKILSAAELPRLESQYSLARAAVGRGVLEYDRPLGDGSIAVLPMELAAADARSLRAKAWTQSMPLLREVAESLALLHSNGIVHRDLKPSNVLIGFDGRARVADFGCATRFGEMSVQGLLSPFSASPQQHAGEPASPADDIFGFGALAYELLGGYPPNFPDTERARSGVPPPRLATSVPMPEALVDLVMSMLAANPADRPQDLREIVRTLEKLEAQRLTPVVAAKIVPLDVAVAKSRDTAASPPSAAAWIGLAALALALVGVFVFLPGMVATPVVGSASASGAAEPGVPKTTLPSAQDNEAERQRINEFEQANERFRVLLEELETQGAGVWGGATFAAAKSLGAMASDAETARDWALALDRISVANQRLSRIAEERPQALARQLRDAEVSLESGRLEAARQSFELAQRIDPTNADAGRGLARVTALGPVLPSLVAAETASLTLDHLAALTRYEEVLRADPLNRVAREGVARARAAIGTDRYAREIGEALSALRAGKTAEARAALGRARGLRPDGAEIPLILAQIEATGERRDLEVVRAEIEALESDEQWGDALLRYDTLLARDPTLAFARTGRARVAPRAQLARRIDALLANPARLSAPEVRREGERLLAEAVDIKTAAPVLRRQADSLRETLRVYDQPVLAVLESDGVTVVSVQRVGSFGAFTRREVSLKPGRYVAIGSRPGFRDVRREFTVTPGDSMLVIAVRCTELVS
jgi:tetratricopeptide (TPR) repeat protein